MKFLNLKSKGSALLHVFIIGIVLATLLYSLSQFTVIRARAAQQPIEDNRLRYGVESAVARIQRLVSEHGFDWVSINYTLAADAPQWIPKQGTEHADFTTNGDGWFKINGENGQPEARVRIIKLQTGVDDEFAWYQAIAQARFKGKALEMTTLFNFIDSMSRYARFVNNGNLSVGEGAEYVGAVHANGQIQGGSNTVVFHENAAAATTFTGTNNTTFLKQKIEGAGNLTIPGDAEVENIKNTLDKSTTMEFNPAIPKDIVYDASDANFRTYFKANAATTSNPTDDLEVHINFKKDKMDVRIRSKINATTYKEFVKTNLDVPHDHVIFVKGEVFVRGSLSRRTTVYAQKTSNSPATRGNIYLEGPINYVNDEGTKGDPMYKVFANATTPSTFNSSTNVWGNVSDWKIPPATGSTTFPAYMQDSRVDGSGNPLWNKPTTGELPALGLVSTNKVKIDYNNLFSGNYTSSSNGTALDSNSKRNMEVHAFIYSSGGIIETSNFPSAQKNLVILGSIITSGTNPLSGAYSFRKYIYDSNLTVAPPKFPYLLNPKFFVFEMKKISAN